MHCGGDLGEGNVSYARGTETTRIFPFYIYYRTKFLKKTQTIKLTQEIVRPGEWVLKAGECVP